MHFAFLVLPIHAGRSTAAGQIAQIQRRQRATVGSFLPIGRTKPQTDQQAQALPDAGAGLAPFMFVK